MRTWEHIAIYVLDMLAHRRLTPDQAEHWLAVLVESAEYEDARG